MAQKANTKKKSPPWFLGGLYTCEEMKENLRKLGAFEERIFGLTATPLKKLTDDDLDVLIQFHHGRAMRCRASTESVVSHHIQAQGYQLEQIRRLLAGAEKR